MPTSLTRINRATFSGRRAHGPFYPTWAAVGAGRVRWIVAIIISSAGPSLKLGGVFDFPGLPSYSFFPRGDENREVSFTTSITWYPVRRDRRMPR